MDLRRESGGTSSCTLAGIGPRWALRETQSARAPVTLALARHAPLLRTHLHSLVPIPTLILTSHFVHKHFNALHLRLSFCTLLLFSQACCARPQRQNLAWRLPCLCKTACLFPCVSHACGAEASIVFFLVPCTPCMNMYRTFHLAVAMSPTSAFVRLWFLGVSFAAWTMKASLIDAPHHVLPVMRTELPFADIADVMKGTPRSAIHSS